MKEDYSNIDELIIDYLTKRIDSDSLDVLRQWIEASAENKKKFLEQQEIWYSTISSQDNSRYDKEKAFKYFKSRVQKKSLKERITKRISDLPVYWKVAAMVLVLFGIAYLSYSQGAGDIRSHFADIRIEAPVGSRTKLFLPDGTLVWLNAGSSISYSQGFGVDDRKIKLEGEGYFEVVRNEKKTFHVESKNLAVQVLGTKFNFRDYENDKEVIVSLLEGRVALDNLIKSTDHVSLLPNERAILNKETGQLKLEKINVANTIEWTNDYLFFDEELLTDIAKKLERSYNVKIHIANDSLNTYRFYGNFIRSEQNIEDVMNALSSTNRIRYTMEDREITIY